MNDTYVTLQGWVGNDVNGREVNGHFLASFRVASTPRHYKSGEWVDGETAWFNVNAWRTLGRNVATSVHQGEAVVVHGKLRSDVWEREDGVKSVSYVVEATFVGHDLNKGTSRFERAVRPERQDPAESAEVKEALHNAPVDGPRVSSDGEVDSPAA